jgi:hypothetical protein
MSKALCKHAAQNRNKMHVLDTPGFRNKLAECASSRDAAAQMSGSSLLQPCHKSASRQRSWCLLLRGMLRSFKLLEVQQGKALQ